MRFKQKLKAGSAKAVRGVMAGVLAFGLMPLPAFAADLTAGDSGLAVQEDTAPVAKEPGNTIIAAAYAAAEPAPEILGLNNPNFRNTGEADKIYTFFGDDEVNTNVNPYVYNYYHSKELDADSALTPGIYEGGRGTGQRVGPTTALNDFNGDDSTAAQNAVWKLLPQIILGTGAETYPTENDSTSQYTYYSSNTTNINAVIGAYNEGKEESAQISAYAPVGITYQMTSLPTMVQTMYDLANKAKEIIDDTNTSFEARYGNPVDIAKDYERYVKGSKGVVQWAIDNDKVKKKTVALVNKHYDGTNTYRVITSGYQNGTSATNRYLEAVAGVTNDYFDSATGESDDYESTSNGKTVEVKAKKVTAEELKNNVDVIIVGENGGSAEEDGGKAVEALRQDGLLAKTYYCNSWSSGAAFGVVMNSVENAQNVGRILPCVYPELFNQGDMIAYYYDTFYHLKNDVLSKMVADQMDGVRNWNSTDSGAYLNWEESDTANYNKNNVETLLKKGSTYLKSQSGLGIYMTLVDNELDDNEAAENIDVKKTQNITASDFTKTEGDSAFSIGATTDGKGTLSYISSDTDVATVDSAGKVTIKGAGTTAITITASPTDEYVKAVKVITVTVKAKEKAASDTTDTDKKTSADTTTTTNTAADGEGLAKNESASTGSGATAATVKATSDTAVTYVAPKSKSTKKVTVPDTVTVNGKTYKVTTVAANAFKGSKATSITIGKNVTTLGKGALQNTKKLKKLTLGKSLKKIGKNALKGSKVTKVTLKSSKVTKSSLKNLVKGSKVKTVKLSGVSKKAKKNYKKWAKSLGITVK